MIFSRFGPARVRGLKIMMLEPPSLLTLYRSGIFNFVHFAAEGCVDKIKDAGAVPGGCVDKIKDAGACIKCCHFAHLI